MMSLMDRRREERRTGSEGLTLDSSLTTRMLAWSILFFSGPRPVARGSNVGMLAKEKRSAIMTGAFCSRASRVEDWGEVHARGLYT